MRDSSRQRGNLHARIVALVTLAMLALIEPPRALSGRSVRAESQTAQAYRDPTACGERSWLLTDPALPCEGEYVGHDEPSLLFYSNTPGSGNSATYTLVLPTEPPTPPSQDGSGGIYDFQLFPTFWFGMAMCDTQSYPEFTHNCTPDSDANMFDNPDPSAPDYIGHHPGTAYMELQFYAPGWIAQPLGLSCDGTRWCAALTIDSFSFDPNDGRKNNRACRNEVGEEPQNSAFIMLAGGAGIAPSPLNLRRDRRAQLANVLLMNPGDTLTLKMSDTADGFQVAIDDLTTGQSGSVTASVENGFTQIAFDPQGRNCTIMPYAFHPMYATSGEHTRVPWAAHSYNVAAAFELGHFEYCGAVTREGGKCKRSGSDDHGRADLDDQQCFSKALSTNVAIGGCMGEDRDYDGVSYRLSWPGTDPQHDRALHPSSVTFTSPLFQPSVSGSVLQNYDRVAFETNLPSEEAGFGERCSAASGAGCVDPPRQAQFYPFFSTGSGGVSQCMWQFGGSGIPGTSNDFGGSAQAEFGPLLQLAYPDVNARGGPRTRFAFKDFRATQAGNPCPATAP